jgi:hypothetical protein
MLGALTRPSNPDELSSWITSTLAREGPEALLLCLDNLLYGGLVNSRRSNDTLQQVLSRATGLKTWKQAAGSSVQVLAQASVMRISDNYDATEEKPYWARYGRELFEWSTLLHRLEKGEKLVLGQLGNLEHKIPAEIRNDYLQTRQRNYRVSRKLLEDYVKPGLLDLLSLSMDDSGAAGLNLLERERLMALATDLGVLDSVLSYPGADEVLLALLARAFVRKAGARPRARLIYSPEETASCQSRYEGQTIGQTTTAQLAACGIETDGKQPVDFEVIIHGRPGTQGDHINLPGQPDLRNLDTARSVRQTLEHLNRANQPCILCDVAYANGADPALIEALLESPHLASRVWAYAGWNTTGNTIGSALATGVAAWFSAVNSRANASGSAGGSPAFHSRGTGENAAAGGSTRPATMLSQHSKDTIMALKSCLFVRLADDWAYQSVVRKTLNGPCEPAVLKLKLAPYLKRISDWLNFEPASLEVSQPWHRTFEIEIAL